MYDPNLIFTNFSELIHARKIWVAYSGGIDSHVLLHSLTKCLNNISINAKIIAIHINHGLNKDSDFWQEHVREVCDELQIDSIIEKVYVDNSIGNIESHAREARYGIFNKYVLEKDILLTAHHQDDQAETLLLRLLRGTGVKGLSAIPKIRKLNHGTVIRPLLNISRDEIINYAKGNKLIWIDDGSNYDVNFDRNYLRHKILPLLKSRWPNYSKIFQRSINNNIESSALLDELAQIDIKNCQYSNNVLKISELNKLSLMRQKNVIRYFIKSIGFNLPSSKHLELIISNVVRARQDAVPEMIICNYSVRKFRDGLYFINKSDKFDLSKIEIELNLEQQTILPNNIGILINDYVLGDGICINNNAKLLVKFRQGGEKILSSSSKKHLSLKKMFNYWNIPPWERGQIPIIYHGDLIISVIGYYTRSDYLPEPNKHGLIFTLKHN